jgi:putative transposase
VKLQRGTLKRLDEAFQAFFRRFKRGEKPGFPRFKGSQWFTSFHFAEWSGVAFENGRIRFKGMPGGLRVHLHRPLPSEDILSAILKRDLKGWNICLVVRVPVGKFRNPKRIIGADVGVLSLVALSTGETIPNPRHARTASRKIRVLQRALWRCKRGSKRRRMVKARLARHHEKIRNSRSTYLHQVSARLVRDYDLIAVEKLNIKGLSGGILARDVQDASWGRLRANLAYKALKAGCRVVEVDPKYTSQTCPECGTVEKKTLSDRVHECDCGCVLDRDVAAARVILSRAVAGPGFAKPLSAAA